MILSLILAATLVTAQEKPPQDPLPPPQEPLPVPEMPPPAPKPPTRPQTPTAPFFDFNLLEVGAGPSFLIYGGDFEADSQPGVSLFATVPMPWMDLGEEWPLPGETPRVGNPFAGYFSLYVEFIVSQMERDLSSAVAEDSGTDFFVGGGLAYTFYQSTALCLHLSAGLQYGDFGGVERLNDGVALTLGLFVGLRLGRGFSVAYMPEFAMGEGQIFFNHLSVFMEF